jgi:host factor-I protein
MPTTEFDTTLPSVRLVQTFIKQAAPLEIKLLTGDVLVGRIIWQDPHCMLLVDESSQQNTIWKQAIAYIKPHK